MAVSFSRPIASACYGSAHSKTTMRVNWLGKSTHSYHLCTDFGDRLILSERHVGSKRGMTSNA